MSKIKKVLAVFLTLAMVLGMGMTTFAEEGKIPTKDDNLVASVNNVETGATVTAYQIVKADYNENGFYGYSEVLENSIANVLSPTSTEITALAGNAGKLTNAVQMTPGVENDGLCSYSASLNVGSWMVLVRGTKEVYNPMLVSVYYSESGSDNQMSSAPVDANSNWTLETKDAYAKSSDVPITKTADKETANLGDTVNFEIKTIVPSIIHFK